MYSHYSNIIQIFKEMFHLESIVLSCQMNNININIKFEIQYYFIEIQVHDTWTVLYLTTVLQCEVNLSWFIEALRSSVLLSICLGLLHNRNTFWNNLEFLDFHFPNEQLFEVINIFWHISFKVDLWKTDPARNITTTWSHEH